MKRKHSKKTILVFFACVLVLVVCAWWAFSVIMYNSFFNKHFESYEAPTNTSFSILQRRINGPT